jgi:hypothetical protein
MMTTTTRTKLATNLEINNDSSDENTDALHKVPDDVNEGGFDVQVAPLVFVPGVF